MKKQISIFILMIFTIWGGNAQTRLVKVQDTIRQFTLYKSSKILDGETAPLLLNFHGWGMTALEHMMYTQTNKIAEEKDLIVVYPQGLDNDWNVGFEQDYHNGTNDVEFISVLIEKVVKNYPIDTSRIYAIGLSIGGFFAQRLVAELPGQIKGFVSVGAPMSTKVMENMSGENLVKAMYVHGTSDEIVNRYGEDSTYLSLDECISYWKTRNQISNKSSTKTYDGADAETSAIIFDYTTVAQIVVENGGHTWPDADPFNIGFPLGKTIQGIHFNLLMYNFLFNSSLSTTN